MAFKSKAKPKPQSDERIHVQMMLTLKAVMLIATKLDDLIKEVRNLSNAIKDSTSQEEVH